MENDKQRLVELIKGAGVEANKYINEIMREVIDKEFRFASKEDIDWEKVNKIEADYLLANGVILPPCKVGDVVYQVTRNFISEFRVRFIEIATCGNLFLHTDLISGIIHTGEIFPESDISKTVFLTKKEAEQALNSIQNGNSCEGGVQG